MPLSGPVRAPLDLVRELAGVATTGAFVDAALLLLGREAGGSLVSYNRLHVRERTATVAFRPYRPEHAAAVDGVARMLDQHPLLRWYSSQPDWSPRRISDVVPWEAFRTSRLFTEVLDPIGARHTLVVPLTPLRATEAWVYFAVTRGDAEFSDAHLDLCTRLQPALVALHRHLAGPPEPSQVRVPVPLTPRERTVLSHLAGGLTAEAIARRTSTSPATVRKHLQNLYGKLDASDRLGAVLRGRDLGLLRADELTRAFVWNVHARTAPDTS